MRWRGERLRRVWLYTVARASRLWRLGGPRSRSELHGGVRAAKGEATEARWQKRPGLAGAAQAFSTAVGLESTCLGRSPFAAGKICGAGVSSRGPDGTKLLRQRSEARGRDGETQIEPSRRGGDARAALRRSQGACERARETRDVFFAASVVFGPFASKAAFGLGCGRTKEAHP